MSTPPERFCIVDTAVGGEKFRNHPMALSAFFKTPHELQVDVYVTAFRYTEDLLAHWRNITNERGNQTVAGYRGPCWAPALFFDLDCEGQPERSLEDARRLVTYLANAYDVPADAVRVVFSGNKGFHLELPGTLFGGFAPSEALPARFAVLATHLATQAGLTPAAAGGTFDAGIYNPLRLFRVENTRHSKTRLHAIPLSADELFSLDIAAIKRLAKTPRTVERLPDDEWLPREDLVSLWERSLAAARTQEARDFARDAAGKIPHGARHNFLIAQAARLERGGVSEAGRRAALLALNAAELAEPLDEGEVLQIAAHAHPAGERDEWGDTESITSLKRDLATAQAQLERVRAARDLAEEKARKSRQLLNHIGEVIANSEMGPEKVALIGLIVADWREDPLVRERVAGGYRLLTGKRAAALLGLSEKQALKNVHLVAQHGLIAITKVDMPTGKIGADGKPIMAASTAFRFADEDETADQLAADNHLSILRAAERMKSRTKPGRKSFPVDPSDPLAPVGRKQFYFNVTTGTPFMAVDGTWTADPTGNDFPPYLDMDGNDFRWAPPKAAAEPPRRTTAGGCPRCGDPEPQTGSLCSRCLFSYGTRYTPPAYATGAAGGD